MPNIRANNRVEVTGRLAQDPYLTENANGSHTVFLTVMVDDNITTSKGEKLPAEAIRCQRYLPESTDLSAWPYGVIAKGDRVTVFGHLTNGAYQKADGTMDYSKPIVFVIDSVNGAESKAARENRAKKRATSEAPAETVEVEEVLA